MLELSVSFGDNLHVHVEIDFVFGHRFPQDSQMCLDVVLIEQLNLLPELRIQIDQFRTPDQVLPCYYSVFVIVNQLENKFLSLSRILTPKRKIEPFEKRLEVNA